MAIKRNIPILFFDIIYKMTEFLTEEMEKRRPRIETTEIIGKMKVLKAFSRTKERQVIGGKVLEGKISLGTTIKITRRDFEIGSGRIVNLEKNKAKTSEVEEGAECGMMIESKIEIAAGDVLESLSIVQK
jgi:translation initiation factor IF-2